MAPSWSKQKKLGQCFLVDQSIAEKIVTESGVGEGDMVLEVGPGKGILTRSLLNRGAAVHAVELDGELYQKLKVDLEGEERLTIERGNALKFDYSSIDAPYHVISNLPYSVSVPLIKKFLENLDRIKSMTLMTQMEVGQRLAAKADDSHYGSLSIYAAYHCDINILFDIEPAAFRPKPKVDSAVIQFKPHHAPPVEVFDKDDFFRFTQTAFMHRRKTLKNNISGLWNSVADFERTLKKVGLDRRIRPENVSIEKFAELFNEIPPENRL